MMRRLVLAFLCVLIQGTSLCYGQHTIYIYIVPPISAEQTLQVYAKNNTTVKWVALTARPDGTGPSFEVKFPNSTPPCQFTDSAHLTAKYHHDAECKIKLPKGYKKDTVLHFQYSIVDTTKDVDPHPVIFFQHVGSCDPCSDPGGPVPVGASPMVPNTTDVTTSKSTDFPSTYIETLTCKSDTLPNNINPDPALSVIVGDTVYWQNPDGVGHPSWTIQFDSATACKVAPTFKDPTCEVTATPSATAYTYHVVVGNGQSPKGCKFDGTITVSAPPAK
jgi:plastocyanin